MEPTKLDFSSVDMSNPSDWVKTETLAEAFSNIPAESIRHVVRNRKEKGLAPACKRIGKFLFTNKKGFAFWMVDS